MELLYIPHIDGKIAANLENMNIQLNQKTEHFNDIKRKERDWK